MSDKMEFHDIFFFQKYILESRIETNIDKSVFTVNVDNEKNIIS